MCMLFPLEDAGVENSPGAAEHLCFWQKGPGRTLARWDNVQAGMCMCGEDTVGIYTTLCP